MKDHAYIYADNAATTKLAPEALDAMMPFLTNDYGNPSSLYSLSRSSKKALEESRAIIAECINADPEEIVFTCGGTESDNWAIKNFVHSDIHRSRNIIISRIEHHAVFYSCREAATFSDYTITAIPVDKEGKIILPTYEISVAKRPDGISIMLANNEIGTIENIAQLVEIAHKQNIPFHTDAVQAIGHIPVDVKTLGVDMMSASAHKFNGPKGIGFLYVKQDTPLIPFMNGGEQEAGRRAGTENVAGIVGMAAALKLNCERMVENNKKLERMTDTFHSIVSESLPCAVFNGAFSDRIPGHISLSLPGITSEGLMHILDLRGIAVSTGAACNSSSTEISHVLNAIGLPDDLARGTIRITFGADNAEEEASLVANEIIKCYKKLLV